MARLIIESIKPTNKYKYGHLIKNINKQNIKNLIK